MNIRKQFGAMVAGLSLIAVGCGGGEQAKAPDTTDGGKTASLTGAITIDGSSTVFPIAQAYADEFGRANSGVSMTVKKSGTGSGMGKFVRGEIDICSASRPIKDSEIEDAKKGGIDFVEVPIALDGISVIVSKQNTALTAVTKDDLKKAWEPKSPVTTWADLKAGLPADKIAFYGPTTNHGTYEFFTEAVVGKKGQQREDANLNQDYNSIVASVAGDKNALGYVGYSYFEENQDKVAALTVNGIAPTVATISDGSYPLSRALYLYVSKKALDRPEVKAFFEYALGDGVKLLPEVNFVALPEAAYAAVKKHVEAGTFGKVVVPAGKTIADAYGK